MEVTTLRSHALCGVLADSDSALTPNEYPIFPTTDTLDRERLEQSVTVPFRYLMWDRGSGSKTPTAEAIVFFTDAVSGNGCNATTTRTSTTT